MEGVGSSEVGIVMDTLRGGGIGSKHDFWIWIRHVITGQSLKVFSSIEISHLIITFSPFATKAQASLISCNLTSPRYSVINMVLIDYSRWYFSGELLTSSSSSSESEIKKLWGIKCHFTISWYISTQTQLVNNILELLPLCPSHGFQEIHLKLLWLRCVDESQLCLHQDNKIENESCLITLKTFGKDSARSMMLSYDTSD